MILPLWSPESLVFAEANLHVQIRIARVVLLGLNIGEWYPLMVSLYVYNIAPLLCVRALYWVMVSAQVFPGEDVVSLGSELSRCKSTKKLALRGYGLGNCRGFASPSTLTELKQGGRIKIIA